MLRFTWRSKPKHGHRQYGPFRVNYSGLGKVSTVTMPHPLLWWANRRVTIIEREGSKR